MYIHRIQYGSKFSSVEINKLLSQIDSNINSMTINNFNGFEIIETTDNNVIFAYDASDNRFDTLKTNDSSIGKAFYINNKKIIGFPTDEQNILIYDSIKDTWKFVEVDFSRWRKHKRIFNIPIELNEIKRDDILIYHSGMFENQQFINQTLSGNPSNPLSGHIFNEKMESYATKKREAERSIEQVETKFIDILADLPMFLEFNPFSYIEPPKPNFKIVSISGDTVDEDESSSIDVTITNKGNKEHTLNVSMIISSINYSESIPITLEPEGNENDEGNITFTVNTSFGDAGIHDIEVSVQDDTKVEREGLVITKVPDAEFDIGSVNNARVER